MNTVNRDEAHVEKEPEGGSKKHMECQKEAGPIDISLNEATLGSVFQNSK